MTHILWLIPAEYVVSSWLKYQSIPSYYGYGIENGTTTATGSESFFNKILVWLVLNMRWNSKRSSYQWIIYLNHTFTYRKKLPKSRWSNCTHNQCSKCTPLTAIDERFHDFGFYGISLALEYQPELYGQRLLIMNRSNSQGFTSGLENGRSKRLKVDDP